MPTREQRLREWGQRHLHLHLSLRKLAGAGDGLREQLRKEAEAHKVTLANKGEGGLDPALALRVFQRDEWRCSIPKCKTPTEDLDLDHIGGHPLEIKDDPEADAFVKKAAKLGHKDSEENIHVLCKRHHDLLHSRERALESGNDPNPVPR